MDRHWWIMTVLIGLAAYTDLKDYRIPNLLTLAGTGIGLAVGGMNGASGIGSSAAGFAAGFGLMLVLHLTGALGAGDVKLFGAIGAVGGAGAVFSIAMYSVLFAGLIGIVILAAKGLLRDRGKDLFFRLFRLICLKQTDAVRSLRSRKDLLRFPFMLAVVPGFFASLLEAMG
ncbi:A24 family peptidase [Gorillibacterium sp. sgz5001074]|uniref:A24 family peptidase n=1 Tax=Gorillibacterium sp. sgz5001074 TaxID=3446695 RepID=UPI003F68076F